MSYKNDALFLCAFSKNGFTKFNRRLNDKIRRRCYDISGGILETDDPEFKKKKKELNREGVLYRINHLSWWEQELANEEEMQEGRNNLRAHDYTVDYIVTHCCSTSTQASLDASLYKPDRETDYLEFIKNYANFKKWFFGHYHDNRNVSDKEILIYEQMIRIS